jgi:hypothetical protein
MQNFEGDNTGGDSIELASYRLSRSNDEMIHSEIRALYNYWKGLRGDRPCPYRAEIDPRDMTGDAGYLFALEDLILLLQHRHPLGVLGMAGNAKYPCQLLEGLWPEIQPRRIAGCRVNQSFSSVKSAGFAPNPS